MKMPPIRDSMNAAVGFSSGAAWEAAGWLANCDPYWGADMIARTLFNYDSLAPAVVTEL
jgi:hypothetical protein